MTGFTEHVVAGRDVQVGDWVEVHVPSAAGALGITEPGYPVWVPVTYVAQDGRWSQLSTLSPLDEDDDGGELMVLADGPVRVLRAVER